MKALVIINGTEKELIVASMMVDGNDIDVFDPSKTTCFKFKKSTVNGFTLAWATWNATYKKWHCCCKGKGLNSDGDANILKIFTA